jgi:hypothetical protein
VQRRVEPWGIIGVYSSDEKSWTRLWMSGELYTGFRYNPAVPTFNSFFLKLHLKSAFLKFFVSIELD